MRTPAHTYARRMRLSRLAPRPLAAAGMALLVLTAAGCGGHSDAAAATAISDSIMRQQKSGSTQVLNVDRKQADCIGKGLVDKIGTDRLQKYGLLTKNLKMSKSVTSVQMSSKDANAAADTFFACTNVMKMIHDAMTQNAQISPTVQACFDKALTKPTVHGMFVAMFEGKQQQATKDLSSKLMSCALGSGTAPSP